MATRFHGTATLDRSRELALEVDSSAIDIDDSQSHSENVDETYELGAVGEEVEELAEQTGTAELEIEQTAQPNTVISAPTRLSFPAI